MNKEDFKIALSAYRPWSQEDANDPHFAEALRAAEGDPELAEWFAEQQRFDEVFSEKLAQAPAPARRPTGAPKPLSFPKRAAGGLAIAASVIGAFFVGRAWQPREKPSAADALAVHAISYSEQMPALQFVCFNASEVKHWVDEKSAAMDMGELLPAPVPNMKMIGSSVTHWEGKPVVMVALQNGEHMAMLYLLRADDFPAGAKEAGKILEKDGWASKVGQRGDHLFILTAKGTSHDLDFPMPL